jgi:serine protease Do
MSKKTILLTAALTVSAIGAGCSASWLTGGDMPNVQAPAAPPPPIVVDGVRTSYADVVEKTAAAVVRIEAEARNERQQAPQGRSPLEDFFRQFPGPGGGGQGPRVERGMGSGVIVSADGTLLTNAHVIDGAQTIRVLTNDNRSYDAKLVGIDKPSDLAVLKIDAQNTPFLTLGNSDSVRVGDIVLAIGNPLGIGQTVTAGIISAKGRRTGLSDGSFEDFLQTDAPINRGNSGGALVNLSGELIGINSQILSPPGSGGNIGIGFSIPSNMAKSVMDQLLESGRVRRGMLGVNIQNITGDTAQALDLPEASGVLVSNVRAGSAADKAGVKRGDIITAINGEKIDDGNVLRNKIAGTLPGSDVRISILRDGGNIELTAKLDEFDTETAAAQPESQGPGGEQNAQPAGRLGVTLQPVNPQLARQFGTGDEKEGLVVTDLDQAGAAADAGIARGDIILEVNRQPVTTPEAVESAIQAAGNRPVLLLVSRKGTTVFLTVRPR